MKRVLYILIFLFITSLCLFSSDLYSYDDLYRAMLNNNTQLKSATQDIYNARLDVKDAQASYYPSIDLTLMGVYMFNPMTISTDSIKNALPQGLQQGVGQRLPDEIEIMDNTLYNASVSLTQPLITWGKIPLSVKLYKTVESIQTDKKTDLERQLESELKIRLNSLMYVKEIDSLIQDAMSKAEELVSFSESAQESGMLLEQDVLEAEISKLELDVREGELDSQRNSLMLGLRVLTGLNDLTEDQIAYTPEEDILNKYKDATLQDLEDRATSPGNTSLMMIEKLKSVHKLEEDINWRSIYGAPDFALQASAGYGGSKFPGEKGWMDADDWSASIAVVMSASLWDGGKTLNSIDRAKSSQISDQIQYDDALNTIISTVEDNYDAMQLSLKRVNYLELKGQSLESALNLLNSQMENGQASNSDYLQKELEVIENKIAILTEKISIVQNVYLLDYLTYPEPIAVVKDAKSSESAEIVNVD